MRNVTKMVLLVCTALTALVFTSCEAIAEVTGQSAAKTTTWIRLTPATAVDIDGIQTATLTLDFSRPVAGLSESLTPQELAELITFEFDYPAGTLTEEKLRAIKVVKMAEAEAMYALTVANVPDNAGIAQITVNIPNITPPFRPWSLNGRVIPDVDASAALLDFRFERSRNPTLSVDEVVGSIDQLRGSVVVVVPMHTILKPLQPSVLTNLGNTYTPLNATDFSINVPYTVTSSKTHAEKDYMVSVIPQTPESAQMYIFNFIKEENTDAGLGVSVYGIIDEEEKTVSITVPYGTTLTSLIPNITHSGESITPENHAAEDFTNPVQYTVSAADDSTTINYRVSVTVAAELPTYGIALSRQTNEQVLDLTHGLTFSDLIEGYTSEAIKAMLPDLGVVVSNTGNQPTGDLTVTLEGGNADSFYLDTKSSSGVINSIEVGGIASFLVHPIDELVVQTHTATVTVRGDHGIVASFAVQVTVNGGFSITLKNGSDGALIEGTTCDFDSREYAYSSAPLPLSVLVINSGNQPTGELSIDMTRAGASSFNISPSRARLAAIEVGDSSELTVQPKDDLGVGQHTVTITISGDHGITKSFNVNFPVHGAFNASVASASSGSSVFSAVAKDEQGNTYTAGNQYGADAVAYGGVSGVTGRYSGTNAVIVKSNSAGVVQWAKTVSATSAEAETRFNAVAVSADGASVYAAGYQTGAGTFVYDGKSAVGAASGNNAVLVKYSSAGAAEWAKTTAATSVNADSVFNALTVSGASIYAAGSQTGAGTFVYGSKSGAGSCTAGTNAVLVHYNSSGEAQWVKSAAGVDAASVFMGVAADGAGIYAAGSQKGTGTFNYGHGVLAVGTTESRTSALVVHYDSAGDAQWAKVVRNGQYDSVFNGIAADGVGSIYVAGTQSGGPSTIDYGNEVSAATTHSGLVSVK